MTSRERLKTAWSFRQPDRVPIEMRLGPGAQGLPGSDKIQDFIDNEADNFRHVGGFDWGFLGLDSVLREEVIEDVPGDYKRIRRTQSTPAGDFTAITKHNYADMDTADCHWEKRYIDSIDDMRLLAKAERTPRPFNLERYNEECRRVGDRGLPCTMLLHPLGTLVRNSNMEEAYLWMLSEEGLLTEFLANCNNQVAQSISALAGSPLVDPPIFMTFALEMLIPPWMGRYQFDKLVFPFDKQVNDSIHRIGGKHRAHCHGKCSQFLERFADMGVDAVEPLEPPPFGDNILEDAKKRVGRRMLLSGNVPSQSFHFDKVGPRDVRELVRSAIKAGARGGGFTLKTTGYAAGDGKTPEQCIKSIDCNLALIDAWREFCDYR